MNLSFVKKLGKALIDLFYPPACAACGAPGYDLLCPECRGKMEEAFSPKKFLCTGGNGFADEMICLFPYQNRIVQQQLLVMKREVYDNNYDVFLRYLDRADKVLEGIAKCDFITFCPRSSLNRRRYGFDQSQELAKRLSHHLGIPLRTPLSRRGFSFTQHRMTGKDRWRNVNEKFVCRERLEGESILLVDDIVTTGATACEAARILKKSGAMKITVFSLAH